MLAPGKSTMLQPEPTLVMLCQSRALPDVSNWRGCTAGVARGAAAGATEGRRAAGGAGPGFLHRIYP